ncbi:uncharacterized protein LOC119365828 [Triticum dicoccoides]|uniref:uncharacterized protein LOC119365828 n=1 Tax=Triticum dicoccoides TaxID=85692 RepID=UPI00188ED35C|nr:uncharacterized protein LOC119365828 [Triticum dicoccoides]
MDIDRSRIMKGNGYFYNNTRRISPSKKSRRIRKWLNRSQKKEERKWLLVEPNQVTSSVSCSVFPTQAPGSSGNMELPRLRRSPPALPDHLLEEIFSRLPPSEPSCLLRACLVCKHWRDIISAPSFLRHLHAHRRAPKMLGFLQHSEGDENLPVYVPTSPFSFPVPDPRAWHVLGYRHGRAVFVSDTTDRELLVWEPFTGNRWNVPVPAELKIGHSNATVLCTAEGCDHLNCHGGPFRVVLVFTSPFEEETEWLTSAAVYSSETGAWGEVALALPWRDGFSLLCENPGLLVGNSLLYFLYLDGHILEYNLAEHVLNVINPPEPDNDAAFSQRVMLVQAEDGGLGIAKADDGGWNHLYLWSRKVSEGGDAEWVECPFMYLGDSLPFAARSSSSRITVFLMGFVEGANTILVSTVDGFFSIELQSKRGRKMCKDRCRAYPLVPVVSSYSILRVPQVEHDSLGSPDFNGESDDEEWEWEALRQAESLFYSGSMAIKEGDFVAAVDCLSRVLAIRVAHYGELAPECASVYYKYGCALLWKAQKATNPLGNLPKKGTISKAHSEEWENSNGEDQEDRKGDNEMAGAGDVSDVDLAGKMLDTARIIMEKTADNTVEISRILSALTEVSMEKRKRGIN